MKPEDRNLEFRAAPLCFSLNWVPSRSPHVILFFPSYESGEVKRWLRIIPKVS
jgi:hypothetical protein